MKLEFESNAVSSPLVSNHIPSEIDEHSSSSEVLELLRSGIKAAQDGDRSEARNLLLRVTETDPENENAWLWLASISEYPEELLVFLNNVLKINPDNERALDWAKATRSLIAKTFVQRGIDAAKDDQKKLAKQCFLQAIVHDSESELAYLWLASVADSPEEKMAHLQRVLSLNPENENALSSLKNARERKARELLPKANMAAISGKHDVAHQLLDEILEDAPDFEDAWMLKAHISESFKDKIEAFECVLEINPENPVALANIESLNMFSSDSENEVPGIEAAEDITDSPDSANSEETDDESEAAHLSGENEADEEAAAFDAPEADEEAAEFDAPEADAEAAEFDAPEADQEAAEFDAPEEEPSTEETSEEPVSFEEVSATLNAESDEFENSGDVLNVGDAENDAEPESDEDAEGLLFDQSIEDDVAENAESDHFESELEAVDHDYVADSIDFSEDNSSDEEQFSESSDLNQDESELELSGADDSQDSMEAMDADVEETVKDGESEPAMPSFDTSEDFSPEMPADVESKLKNCPYCKEPNESQAFACQGCKAIFTISDIEMILSHQKANTEVISSAVEEMERNKSLRGVVFEELKALAIGYLNIKDFRKGFEYLQEVVTRDPGDVVLVSQMDALALRLAEIEDQERVRENEPMVVGKKILVVDDSPTVRKLISGKLEKCGHEPVCAVDGMDALAKINEEIPDLVLLDITMPRMDGYQVCKLIRSNEATKDVPVVMISGKDGFFDKVRGRMAGTSHYITKPFGPETLMKTVNEYIQ